MEINFELLLRFQRDHDVSDEIERQLRCFFLLLFKNERQANDLARKVSLSMFFNCSNKHSSRIAAARFVQDQLSPGEKGQISRCLLEHYALNGYFYSFFLPTHFIDCEISDLNGVIKQLGDFTWLCLTGQDEELFFS